jgi:hypothetical protein
VTSCASQHDISFASVRSANTVAGAALIGISQDTAQPCGSRCVGLDTLDPRKLHSQDVLEARLSDVCRSRKAVDNLVAQSAVVAREWKVVYYFNNPLKSLLSIATDASDKHMPDRTQLCCSSRKSQMLKAQILEFDRAMRAWQSAALGLRTTLVAPGRGGAAAQPTRSDLLIRTSALSAAVVVWLG